MRLIVVGLCLLLAVATVTAETPVLISETEPKILCLYSKELRNGMDFNAFCSLTKQASSDVSVFISIRKNMETTSDLAFTDSMFTITIGSGDVHGSHSLYIPFDLATGAYYYIHTSFTGLAIKPLYEQVVVYRPELPYFITTDKPIYKPGEDVLIRGLTCDMYLKPTATSATIEIKDSNDIKIEKITSVQNANTDFPTYISALIDTNFTLSDEPVPGMYTVSLYTDEGYVEKKFEVKEFVLPRFEVQIELEQPYLISGDDEIRGKIKAVYSYGEDVLGSARIKMKNSQYRNYDEIKYAWDIEVFEGSEDFVVKIDEKSYPMPFYGNSYLLDTALYLQGEVIEANTGDVQSVEVSVTIYRTEFTAKLGPMPLLFRGNPDYTFPVALTNPVGGMISDYSGYTLYYKTRDDRKFSSMVVSSNPMNVNVRLNTSDTILTGNEVEVYFTKDEVTSPHVRQIVIKYYTWSNQTLKVEPVSSNSKDERCFKITPFKSGDIAYYQVVNNYYAEQIIKYEDTNGYCLQVEQKHTPQTRVLGYKIIPYTDGKTSSDELVTAYLDIEITWSPLQKVELEVTSKTGEATVRPGEDVEILVKTNGKAIVALKGVDKRLSYMGDLNDMTLSKTEDAVVGQRSYDRKKDNPIPNPPIFPMPFFAREPMFKRKKRCSACIKNDQYMDPRKLLEGSGQIIVTNIDIKRQETFTVTDDFNYMYEDRFVDFAPVGAEEDISENKMAGAPNEEADMDDGDEDDKGDEEGKVRSDFPETWLWEILLTEDNGIYKKDMMVPDSITNWEITAFGFNKEYGLSVSEKREITVFQEFFISIYKPYSVVQSERVKLDILVFNYQDEDLTVLVELVDTDNYTIQDKSIFSKPIKIKAGTSGVQRVFVTFDVIGDIPLKAIAKDVNSNNQDIVIRTLIVKPRGREIREDTSLIIDMTKNTSPELNFNISNFFKEPGYVPNSLRMYLFTTGDMMGPFITLITSKIKMPYGCGEQNIKSLTPSVFVARYLTKLGRLDEKTKSLLKKVCGVGVKKEYNYLHRDGSFSAFGEKDNLCVCGSGGKKFGSTWLTAYVLMSFSLLYSDDITYIDPANLKKSFEYIKNNATVKDCPYQYFVEKGELIHTEMKGISSTRFGFTAFVVIALMDYREAALKAGLTQSAQEAKELAENSINWLKQQQQELLRKKEPYQLAMVAYAMARANTKIADPDSLALLETLEKVLAGEENTLVEEEACVYSATSGESKRCTSDTDCGNGYECCMVPCSNGMKKCSRKPYIPMFRNDKMSSVQQSPSKSIEMSGYRMMAYLYLYDVETDSNKKAMYLEKVEMLKEWLLSKRKGNGLFESTQDTVVALRALAKYAMTFPNQNGAGFTVTAKVDGKSVTETVSVTDDTYTTITEKKLDVSIPPSAVKAAVTGSKGVAYLNLVALYNVAENVTTKPYIIEVEPRKKQNKPLTRVCFNRNPNFTGDIGTMITVTMEAQSGTTVLNVAAENEKDPSLSPTKFDYNKEEGNLNVYYMVNGDPLIVERCMHVLYEVDFEVENKQPKEVRVSNYYSPEVASSILYNVDASAGTELETTTVTIGASTAQMNMLLLLSTILVVMFCTMFM